MANKTLRTCLAGAIIVAVFGFYIISHWKGCNFSGIRGKNFNTSKFDEPFSRFEGAETLRKARSNDLVAEVQKVIDQNGLPADVFVDDTKKFEDAERLPPLNIAETLDRLFYEFYDPNTPSNSPAKLGLEELWDASPDGEWDIDEQILERVRPTLNRFESKRQEVRNALEQRATRLRPAPRFYYIFVYPDLLDPWTDAAVKINTEASRYLHDYALLEEYAIAQALLDGNVGDAANSLAYVFRITFLASHLRNVGTRSDAALTRLRAFEVMQRVMLDPKFGKEHMIFLRVILEEQRKNWIPEYGAWFGDRASGIILYHRVMLYGMDDDEMENVFEPAELNALDARVTRPVFRQGFAKYHEADQAFYLRAMQRVLDTSKEPFVNRRDVLNQISSALFRMEDMRDDKGVAMEPFVANILLKDVERLMRLFARDESALNRTLALLDASLGGSNTDNYRDPFTGQPYEIHREDGFLSITVPELSTFRVPSFVVTEPETTH